MAEANITVARDQFSCSVCLDLFNDPVGLSCGHSFCMVCVNNCWDQEDRQGVYSCPQCRKPFSTRPAVCKNTVLAEVVETLKNTKLNDTRPAECSVGPEDIECDSCTDNKSKAIKSCLVCLASFCETHLQPHYKSPAFKKHKLVEASSRLQEQICSQHDKLLEVYCRTDQRCICMLCTMDEHKGHDTVSITAERATKEKQLLDTQGKSKEIIQKREEELQKLGKDMVMYQCSVHRAVQESERMFTELIKSLEKRCSDVTKMIRAQEKTAVSQTKDVITQLEKEIAEMKRKYYALEQLSHTKDPIQYLQSFPSVSTLIGPSDLSTVTINSHPTFEGVIMSVSRLRKKIEGCCEADFEKILSEEDLSDPDGEEDKQDLSDPDGEEDKQDLSDPDGEEDKQDLSDPDGEKDKQMKELRECRSVLKKLTESFSVLHKQRKKLRECRSEDLSDPDSEEDKLEDLCDPDGEEDKLNILTFYDSD